MAARGARSNRRHRHPASGLYFSTSEAATTFHAHLRRRLHTTSTLIVNLKTAKVLDLSVPAALLARADDVIE
jgi:hypothetical protein